jgi:hypothetical protein
MNIGRVTKWLLLGVWLLTGISGLIRARTILIYGSWPLPWWLIAALVIYFPSVVACGVSTWWLLQERPAVRVSQLVWAATFLLLTLSRMVLYWRVSIIDCVAIAFALGWMFSSARSDSSGDQQPTERADSETMPQPPAG